MRQFYESWTPYIIGSPSATQLHESEIGSPVATQIALPKLQMSFSSSAQEIESAHDFCLSSDDKTIYYRHSDHLGSANWITDFHGDPIQYLHYLPYGQMLLNQQAAGYDERYKFTDKERDAESGYDYFGARYYASPLYNWTSVDPLSDKFPQISPYAYCNWNPIKFVDIQGARPLPIDKIYNGWTAKVDSWFGPRDTGLKGASSYHKGLDLNYSCGGDRDYGTPILATHEGYSHIIDNLDNNAGRYVEITSEDGTVRTRYLHLSTISVIEGQYVYESEKIGEMGGSGKGAEHRWTSHLHYEVQKKINGEWKSIDPIEGKERHMNNILDPQTIIDIDNNLYFGGELPEVVILKY